MTKPKPTLRAPLDRIIWLKVALIILAAAIIYGPGHTGGWLWDDDQLITGNTNLRTLGGLRNIWLGVAEADYWPMTWSVFWLEWHLWGAWSPGFHLVSLGFHLGSAFLFWRVLARLGLRSAWLGGLLLIVHPLMVESVAWASETKNTLSLLLSLLALLAWLQFEENPRKSACYYAALLFYLAALLAKISVIMLPATFLLYAWWKRGEISRRDLQRSAPFFGVAAVLALATLSFQHAAAVGQPVESLGLVARFANAGTAVSFYLGKFVWPVGLLPVYVRWPAEPPPSLHLLTLPLLLLTGAALWIRRRREWVRHLILGLGFFLAMLLPVIGLLDLGYSFLSWVADHFVYVPALGLIGLTVAGFEFLERRDPTPICRIVAIIVLLAMVEGSFTYALLWQSPLKLWTYTYAHNPNSPGVLNAYAYELARQGRNEEAAQMYRRAYALAPDYLKGADNLAIALARLPEPLDESIRIFQHSIAVAKARYPAKTASAECHAFGKFLQNHGRLTDAIAQYRDALQLFPNAAEAHNDLGFALANEPGHLDEAVTEYQAALRIDPTYAVAHNNLGYAYSQMPGRMSDAVSEYNAALDADPNYVLAFNNLGNAKAVSGDLPGAQAEYETALKIDPNDRMTHENLAYLKANALSDLSGAIAEYAWVAHAYPEDATAHGVLGDALAKAGRFDEAATELGVSLRLAPNSAQTEYLLGLVLLKIPARAAEAGNHFQAALRIQPGWPPPRQMLDRLQATMK